MVPSHPAAALMNEVTVTHKLPAPRRKRDARFIEIAAQAGVSISTVNRVLNEHGSVSEAARLRVLEAAKILGIKRLLPDAQHGLTHIDVIITQSTAPFVQRIFAAVQRVVQMLDRRIVVHRMLVADDEKAILEVLNRQQHRRKAIITMIRESNEISLALQRLIDSGTAVVTLVSDIHRASRSYYSGIDNVRAAATAAWFIKKMVKGEGRVLKLIAHDYYVVHEHRSRGFDQALIDEPQLTIVHAYTQERADSCYHAVKQALQQGDLKAIYNSGSGSEGVLAALQEHDAVGKVIWVGHELYDHHNQYLASGALDLVIDQDPDAQVVAAMQQALFACGVLDVAPRSGPVEFKLYCEANRSDLPYVA